MLGKNEAVQRWLALWNGDMDQLSSLVADTVVTHAVLVAAVTDEPLVGRDALCAWIVATHAAMPGLRFSIEVGPLADGDLIAMRWRVQGQQGVARLSFAGTDILRIKDDRIVEYWVSADTVLMMRQMEVAASPH